MRLGQSSGNWCFHKVVRVVYLEMFWDFYQGGRLILMSVLYLHTFVNAPDTALAWCYKDLVLFLRHFISQWWTIQEGNRQYFCWLAKLSSCLFHVHKVGGSDRIKIQLSLAVFSGISKVPGSVASFNGCIFYMISFLGGCHCA